MHRAMHGSKSTLCCTLGDQITTRFVIFVGESGSGIGMSCDAVSVIGPFCL